MLLNPGPEEPNQCGSGSTPLPVAIQYKVFKNCSAFRQKRDRERDGESVGFESLNILPRYPVTIDKVGRSLDPLF